jgi:hypothetical protein
MRSRRSRSRSGVPIATLVIPLLCTAACAYESRGVIEGNLTHAHPPAAPPAQPADVSPVPAHEHVQLTWDSSNGGLSGQIQTSLPDGEAFTGTYHELTSMADRGSGFCGSWYGDWHGGWYGAPWGGPGGAWPYYGSCDEYTTYYSGQVVAMLESDRGTKMRCRFILVEGGMGMAGGGWGECQVSNGDRITAIFDPSDAETVARQ